MLELGQLGALKVTVTLSFTRSLLTVVVVDAPPVVYPVPETSPVTSDLLV